MPLLHYDKLLTSQNVVLDMPFYKNGLCDGGKAIDKSKYHNNATVTGAIWTPPYGYTSDGIDDFLQVPNSISTPLSNADFTILAIIKRVSATAYIISRNMIFDVFDFYKANGGDKAMELDYNAQTSNFASGNYAMMVQGLWAYGSSKSLNPALNAGFFPFII